MPGLGWQGRCPLLRLAGIRRRNIGSWAVIVSRLLRLSVQWRRWRRITVGIHSGGVVVVVGGPLRLALLPREGLRGETGQSTTFFLYTMAVSTSTDDQGNRGADTVTASTEDQGNRGADTVTFSTEDQGNRGADTVTVSTDDQGNRGADTVIVSTDDQGNRGADTVTVSTEDQGIRGADTVTASTEDQVIRGAVTDGCQWS